jgi:hypothetical protein
VQVSTNAAKCTAAPMPAVMRDGRAVRPVCTVRCIGRSCGPAKSIFARLDSSHDGGATYYIPLPTRPRNLLLLLFILCSYGVLVGKTKAVLPVLRGADHQRYHSSHALEELHFGPAHHRSSRVNLPTYNTLPAAGR